jgi:ribokinase
MMRSRAVLVAGSLHFDFVVEAPHLPRADETVMGTGVEMVCGGKGGNQAVASARMGAPTFMAGRIAGDFFGEQLIDNLRHATVDTSLIQTSDEGASGMSVAIVDAQGDYGAVVASGVNQAFDAAKIDWPDDIGVVVLQNEIPETANLTVAGMARDRGATVILNAAPMRTFSGSLLELIDVLVVNRVEAGDLLGRVIDEPGIACDAANRRETGPGRLVITLGADGVVIHKHGERAKHLPAFPVSVVSTHGAGDMFVGALAARLAGGDDFRAAIRFAMAAGALLVSTPLANRGRLSAVDIADMTVRAC